MKTERGHQRYRQLMSDRLDAQLNVLEERQLVRHLHQCAQCRAIQNDFFEQRRQLRALPGLQPPRDLWARTSAALDRELVRDSWLSPSYGAGRRLVRRSAVAGTAMAVGLILVLSVGQLGPTPQPLPEQARSPRIALLPTPFGVAPQPMMLLGSRADGVVLFRAHVDQVCPRSAMGCIGEEDLAPQLIGLPRSVSPANLSVSPDGDKVALTGRGTGSDGVFAVVLPEGALGDEVSDLPTADPEPVPTPPAAATTDPPASATETSAAGTHRTSQSPVLNPSPTAAALAAVTVLDDVQLAGAPPAWSPDGESLAFSARPADGSHGPDIYLWREGEDMAVPLTSDHASYFASWAGQRVVASRWLAAEEPFDPAVSAQPDAEVSQPPDGGISLLTFVIDPASGEERELGVRGIWLPQVNPQGTHGVVWYGSLDVAPSGVVPREGGLYLTDWRQLDPFLVGPQAPAEPAEEPTDGEQASAEPEAEQSPDASQSAPDDASPSAQPPETVAPETPGPDPDHEPSEAPAESIGVELLPLDPLRDPAESPVLDWQVRWSADGAVIGYWVADTLGASWGQLVVLPLAADPADVAVGQPLLGPTLARRSFTLGIDRVAWVGATDAQPEGEVRIHTWGPSGEGGLQLPTLDLREVVPAF